MKMFGNVLFCLWEYNSITWKYKDLFLQSCLLKFNEKLLSFNRLFQKILLSKYIDISVITETFLKI